MRCQPAASTDIQESGHSPVKEPVHCHQTKVYFEVRHTTLSTWRRQPHPRYCQRHDMVPSQDTIINVKICVEFRRWPCQYRWQHRPETLSTDCFWEHCPCHWQCWRCNRHRPITLKCNAICGRWVILSTWIVRVQKFYYLMSDDITHSIYNALYNLPAPIMPLYIEMVHITIIYHFIHLLQYVRKYEDIYITWETKASITCSHSTQSVSPLFTASARFFVISFAPTAHNRNLQYAISAAALPMCTTFPRIRTDASV